MTDDASSADRWQLCRQWIRQVRLRALGAVCGIGLAGALWQGTPLGLRWFKSHPYFRVTTVSVEGNRRLARAEILQWAGVSEGMSIWDVAPNLVRVRLQSHPWIERVRVQRVVPGQVLITVKERRPVAIALLSELNYVDRSGQILGPLQDDDSRNFPIITGLDGGTDQGFTSVALHRALQFLRWCERLHCCETLSEVHVDRSRGVTVFPLRPPVAVALGWGSWRCKLARLARVLAAWEGQLNRVAMVDVSFRNSVVVKLRDDERPGARRAARRGLRAA
jgi:cell division protein FtsQ